VSRPNGVKESSAAQAAAEEGRPPTTLRLISDADLKLQSKPPFATQPWTLQGRIGLNERCGLGGLLVLHMTGLVKEPSLNNGLGSLVRQVTVAATGQSAVESRSIPIHRDWRLAETVGCHHPQPPPQAEGAGRFGDKGPGVAAWRPYPRLLSETLSGF